MWWFVLFCAATSIHFTSGLLDARDLQAQRRWLANPPDDCAELLHYFSSNLAEDMNYFRSMLDRFLIVRTPGSQGSEDVRKLITSELQSQGWTVEYDSFQARIPDGSSRTFRNVIATLNPSAPRRLILACHYDSKTLPRGFLGATDSAVPCVQLLHLAKVMHMHLRAHQEKPVQLVTLQLVFFDGEEPFVEWRNNDNTYGSRHLAFKWKQSNQLDGIDTLMLLDLLGAKNPTITSLDPKTHKWHRKLMRIEKAIMEKFPGLPSSNIFQSQSARNNHIEDDHIPFMRENVPILHIIDKNFLSFGSGWHTLRDNKNIIHMPTVVKLNKIFQVFVAEYLRLTVDRLRSG